VSEIDKATQRLEAARDDLARVEAMVSRARVEVRVAELALAEALQADWLRRCRERYPTPEGAVERTGTDNLFRRFSRTVYVEQSRTAAGSITVEVTVYRVGIIRDDDHRRDAPDWSRIDDGAPYTTTHRARTADARRWCEAFDAIKGGEE
jgi:hypothetical protein